MDSAAATRTQPLQNLLDENFHPKNMVSFTDFDSIFRDITKGDDAAFDFCNAFFRWVHCLDDLVDKDKEVPAHAVSILFFSLIHTVACNPFFQKHKVELLSTMLTASIAWTASEEWKKRPDVLHKITSQVLKSEYQNVFIHVAALCGGQSHAHAMSSKYRDYNFDYETNSPDKE